MTAVTREVLAASRWDTTFIDGAGWSQRRTRCRSHPVEVVVTMERRGPVTRHYEVYGVDIGGTIEDAVAALNDWSIVQRALDAESTHNNVDDGDLHGTRRRIAERRAAPNVEQGSFDF